MCGGVGDGGGWIGTSGQLERGRGWCWAASAFCHPPPPPPPAASTLKYSNLIQESELGKSSELSSPI